MQTLPAQLNDLTGQKFGRLTAIEWLGRQGGGTKWRCLCDCGNSKDVFSRALLGGRTLSCLCLNREVRERNRGNRVGQRHGTLTVTARADINPLSWRCRCDCGAEVVLTPENLKNRKFCSPKCPLRTYPASPRSGVSTPPTGQTQLFNLYRSDAKKRDLQFALDLDFFLSLTSDPCTYCTSPPELVCRYRKSEPYTYTGIDRVRNELGYAPGNVVPCCYRCNRAKGVGTLEGFLAWRDRMGATSIPPERFAQWGIAVAGIPGEVRLLGESNS